jgi:hypothetical protein
MVSIQEAISSIIRSNRASDSKSAANLASEHVRGLNVLRTNIEKHLDRLPTFSCQVLSLDVGCLVILAPNERPLSVSSDLPVPDERERAARNST